VFAELDAGRWDGGAGLVADAELVLIRAAVPADVPAVLAGPRFNVCAGVISRAG
jgi:DNA replication and repair protein RecF